MRTQSIALVLALCVRAPVAAAQPAAAQPAAAADSAPAAVALRSLRARIARDSWAEAGLTHPADLARLKAVFLPLIARDSTGRLARRILNAPPEVRLDTLSDVEFGARLLGFWARLSPPGAGPDRYADARVLAVARPSPDTAYVVYRWVPAPGDRRPVRRAEVVELHHDRGRWWVQIAGDFDFLREVLSGM